MIVDIYFSLLIIKEKEKDIWVKEKDIWIKEKETNIWKEKK